jgi:hypothetical protein
MRGGGDSMWSMERLRVAVRRREGAQDGAQRGRAKGDGAERLGVGGEGPVVHYGWPADEGKHDTWQG